LGTNPRRLSTFAFKLNNGFKGILKHSMHKITTTTTTTTT
jgi:hypothetical protein